MYITNALPAEYIDAVNITFTDPTNSTVTCSSGDDCEIVCSSALCALNTVIFEANTNGSFTCSATTCSRATIISNAFNLALTLSTFSEGIAIINVYPGGTVTTTSNGNSMYRAKFYYESVKYKQFYKNPGNTLSIHILYNAIQSEQDVEFWIVNEKSTLFLWSLSLISSPFEASFQKLEKLILKHSSQRNRLLLQTLFSKNIIDLLLNIKHQNDNDDLNQVDKGTMNFRAHALWTGALSAYYSDPATPQKADADADTANDNDVEMKENDDDSKGKEQNKSSDDIFKLYTESGLFENLLQLLQSDDVLIQINVLPLLSTLSNFECGLRLLLDRNVVKILLHLLQSDDAVLFGKEVYKVLVAMITNTQKVYSGNKQSESVLKWLDDNQLFQVIKLGFQNDDISVQESCCLFLGFFASFPKILKKFIFLQQNENAAATQKLCDCVNLLATNPGAENKALAIAAIHGLCEIMTVRQDDDDQVPKFQVGLIEGIKGGMTRLLELCKHPDDEMRFGVFRLINNICKQVWGISLVVQCGGMFEYLTDRNEPDIMIACQWKYAICESMFKNKNMKSALNQTYQQQLKTYVAQGVVFKSDEEAKKNKKKNRGDNVVQLGWEQR